MNETPQTDTSFPEQRVDCCDGKYTVIHNCGMGLRALRYGKPWGRDLVGDGLVLALAMDLAEAREQVRTLASFVPRIRSYLGNGGLFNPEFMEHQKVRDLLMEIGNALMLLPASTESDGGRPYRLKYIIDEAGELKLTVVHDTIPTASDPAKNREHL